jgi:hypothetical protein
LQVEQLRGGRTISLATLVASSKSDIARASLGRCIDLKKTL